MTLQDLRRLLADAERDGLPDVIITMDRRLYVNRVEVWPGLSGRVITRGGGKGLPARVSVVRTELARVLDNIQP